MTEEDTQTIWVSKGLFEFTRPTYIDETYGRDISALTMLIALGDRDQPPDSASPLWTAATDDPEITPTSTAQRVLVLFVDGSFAATLGPVWIWVMTPDAPEKPARRGAMVLLA